MVPTTVKPRTRGTRKVITPSSRRIVRTGAKGVLKDSEHEEADAQQEHDTENKRTSTR